MIVYALIEKVSSESMKSEQSGYHCKSKAIESCEGAIAVRCLIVVEV